jgi:hypothetical protein
MKTILRVSLSLFAASMSFALFSSCSGTDAQITSYGLTATGLVISGEKGGEPVKPPVFSPGDKIYVRFSLSDYQLDSEGNIWIQEDLIMKGQDNVAILTRPNIINDRVAPPAGTASVPIGNMITLFDTTRPGPYTIGLNVRDKIGGGAVYIEVPVTVKEK